MMKDQNVISEKSDLYHRNIGLDRRGLVILNDPMIICPLDQSHRIRFSKIQCHLERCLIGDLIEMICPWNRLHVVDEASYDHHINHCEDMPMGNQCENQSPDH